MAETSADQTVDAGSREEDDDASILNVDAGPRDGDDDTIHDPDDDETVSMEGEDQDDNSDEGEDDDTDEDDGSEASGLRCSYRTDPKTGATSVRIYGDLTGSITEKITPDGPRYTSDLFKAPQKDLKAALEWLSRNVARQAVVAEWNRQNPTTSGRRSQREKAQEQELALLRQQNAEMRRLTEEATQQQAETQKQLAQIMQQLGLQRQAEARPAREGTDGAEGSPTSSESSAQDRIISQGGTEKRTSRGASKSS